MKKRQPSFMCANKVEQSLTIEKRIRQPTDREQGPFRMLGSSVVRRIAKTKESTFPKHEAIFHSGANETVIRLNSIRYVKTSAETISGGKGKLFQKYEWNYFLQK